MFEAVVFGTLNFVFFLNKSSFVVDLLWLDNLEMIP
jgi:hypothetical protein